MVINNTSKGHNPEKEGVNCMGKLFKMIHRCSILLCNEVAARKRLHCYGWLKLCVKKLLSCRHYSVFFSFAMQVDCILSFTWNIGINLFLHNVWKSVFIVTHHCKGKANRECLPVSLFILGWKSWIRRVYRPLWTCFKFVKGYLKRPYRRVVFLVSRKSMIFGDGRSWLRRNHCLLWHKTPICTSPGIILIT